MCFSHTRNKFRNASRNVASSSSQGLAGEAQQRQYNKRDFILSGTAQQYGEGENVLQVVIAI